MYYGQCLTDLKKNGENIGGAAAVGEVGQSDCLYNGWTVIKRTSNGKKKKKAPTHALIFHPELVGLYAYNSVTCKHTGLVSI